MIWYVLFGYLVVAEISVLAVVTTNFFSGSCPAVEELRREQTEEIGHVQFAIFYFLTPILTAPLTFPVMVYAYFLCRREIDAEAAYWNDVKESYSDLSLDPLHPCNVDEDLLRHFEDQSECLVALGYQSLGDVWLKEEPPFHSKGRFWLDPEQTTLTEIGRTIDTHYCELTSFLDDGSVITSVTCESTDLFEQMKDHGYFFACCPQASMEELVGIHNDLMQRASGQTGLSVRRIAPGQWKAYLLYSNRRFAQVAFELGEKQECPDQVVFPAAEPSQAAATKEPVRSVAEVASRI